MNDISKDRILVVDDTQMNIDLMTAILGNDYDVLSAINGRSALEIARELLPDLILLDIMMPDMNGYEVCRQLKADETTRSIPIIFITALNNEGNEARGLELGAVDYITKPLKPAIIRSRVRNHLELKHYRDHLEFLVRERTQEVMLTQEVAFESLATLAEYRDPETGGHIRRTQNYIRILAQYLRRFPDFSQSLDDATIDLLYKSAPLHDIGKVGVPDTILMKPGKLRPEEFEEMKKHVTYGRDAILAAERKIGESSFLRLAVEIVYTHHEKWDGSGYPEKLAGEAIPLPGRLMALVDVYDALISKRVYKAPYPHEKAVSIIVNGKGSHFDPRIVEAFLALETQFRAIALEHADCDEERRTLSLSA
ncbi:two-component system response regulator [candidate division KSB3 bacterium]|uniref:Two-component system response regulator n=1 Tax=candidate division KSB3 bacterium TaxID=2044937 RepID=A0A2G6E5N3_9BACT|nr:MAG: two-component system response regulator [candidate division KSB3 bacterium]PIE29884.1 MAG: two-component system response regulator [candidate division KSB3 bacterium]